MMGSSSRQIVQRGSADGRRQPERPPPPWPLLWPALAFMGGIWLSETTGIIAGPLRWLPIAVPPVLLMVLLFHKSFRNKHRHVVLGLILVSACGIGFLRHQTAISRPPNHVCHLLSDEPLLTRLSGEVITTPVSRPTEKRNPFIPFDPPARTRFVLAARELRTTETAIPITGRIRVGVDAAQLGLRLGDLVELTGKLYRPLPPRNPGAIDWARWNYLQGIAAGMSVEGAPYVRRLVGEGTPFRRLVSTVRGLARMLLLEPDANVEANEGARLLDTMVLGQRGTAGRKINEAFLRAGGMHFLAVSGFHVGVLAAATWWLVRRLLRQSSTSATLATVIAILTYALVAEPNAPILRAAILGVLAALAFLGRRPYSVLNWLAFAALCLLAINPLELFRPGFQLSLVLVVGLLFGVSVFYSARLTRNRYEQGPSDANSLKELIVLRAGRWSIGLAQACVVAWVIALPLVIFHFGRLAPWGALGTFLLCLPVTILIWLSFLTLIANLVLPPVGAVLSVLLQWATDGLLMLVGLFEHVPAAVVEWPRPPAGLLVVSYAVILMLALFWRTRLPRGEEEWRDVARVRRGIRVRLTIAFVLILLCVLWPVLTRTEAAPGCCVHVLSVGSGSTTLVTTADGHAAFFDVGTDRNQDAGLTAARALRALGLSRLDHVCISHGNFDHYSGVPTLLQKMPVRRILSNPYLTEMRADHAALRLFFDLLPAAEHTIESLAAGDELSLGDVRIEVLWPPAGLDRAIWKTNDRSLVLRLHAGGRTVLLTGDIEQAAMRSLLAAEAAGRINLAADVLIAPHHGSVLRHDTAAFYTAVDPEIVAVSSARPRPKLTALLHDIFGSACRLVYTSDVGAITIQIPPNGEIIVETPFAESQ